MRTLSLKALLPTATHPWFGSRRRSLIKTLTSDLGCFLLISDRVKHDDLYHLVIPTQNVSYRTTAHVNDKFHICSVISEGLDSDLTFEMKSISDTADLALGTPITLPYSKVVFSKYSVMPISTAHAMKHLRIASISRVIFVHHDIEKQILIAIFDCRYCTISMIIDWETRQVQIF